MKNFTADARKKAPPLSGEKSPKSRDRRDRRPKKQASSSPLPKIPCWGTHCGCRWIWWFCASPWKPARDAAEVGRIFGVNLGADGFFLEEHPKLGPLNTATDGVFLAGTCQSPKDIPDTVAQASGAAAKALSLATRGTVQVPSTISWIDPDMCAGCQTCIGLCPYSAIEFDERRGVSVINEAVCKGCGSCSGFCPSGAAQVRHFKERQIFAELDGIMDALKSVGM